MTPTSKLLGALALACGVLGLAGLTGCSIRLQAPIREVAYDFSDRDFYDRAYAPSPTYAPSTHSLMVEPPPPAPEGRAPAPPAVPVRAAETTACEGGAHEVSTR
jgi:hypothetical protein